MINGIIRFIPWYNSYLIGTFHLVLNLHGTIIKLKFGQWRLNLSWSCLNVYYRPGDVSTYNCFFTKLFHISTHSRVNKLLSSFHTLEFISIEVPWSLLQCLYFMTLYSMDISNKAYFCRFPPLEFGSDSNVPKPNLLDQI